MLEFSGYRGCIVFTCWRCFMEVCIPVFSLKVSQGLDFFAKVDFRWLFGYSVLGSVVCLGWLFLLLELFWNCGWQGCVYVESVFSIFRRVVV